jgi:hypothetical protein
MSENEAFFLFVIWNEHRRVVKNDGSRVEAVAEIDIKRASTIKNIRETEKAKRLAIDFDPLTRQVAYSVCIFVTQFDGVQSISHVPIFVEILESEEEAQSLKAKLETGDYNMYLNNKKAKESFEKAEIFPVLINIPASVRL